MIVEIDRDVKIDALHRALLAGGFRIQTLPGGKYRLVQVSLGTAICEADGCDRPASVAADQRSVCAKHWRDA